MGSLIDFTAPVPPVAKARPRVTMVGGNARAYTPRKTADFEKAIALHCPSTMMEGPVKLTLTLALPIPASWSKKKQTAAATHEIRPTSRPDIDNYAKAVMDGLDGRAFADDAQVVSLAVDLVYATDPHVRVIVQPV